MKVKIFAGLKNFFGGKEEIEIPIVGTVPLSEALSAVDLPENVNYVAVKDGRALAEDDPVNNGDVLSLVRFVSGG